MSTTDPCRKLANAIPRFRLLAILDASMDGCWILDTGYLNNKMHNSRRLLSRVTIGIKRAVEFVFSS